MADTANPNKTEGVSVWVPNVHASELPALIRKAHKGKLGRFISADEREAIVAGNSQERIRRLGEAITHTRNPRSRGFV